MTSSLDSDVRERLGRYLSGETSLDAFEAWFVPATWGIERETDAAAFDTTNEIYLRLAEYSYGHLREADLSEAELRHLLRPLAGVPATVA
jgi:hypothetical protein